VTTPFDDPQAELAWMFLQNLSEDGDLDEGFDLLSDDFIYWNNSTGKTYDKTELREFAEQLKATVEVTFELLNCHNDGRNVVIEALPDALMPSGVRYRTPIAYVFETNDGLITSLREYGDTRFTQELFGVSPG
jgi:uncharacterized protein